MKIIVVGAGRVGRRAAAYLSKYYDVIVVDRNPELMEELTYSLDVMTVPGDATLPETLIKAGTVDADYLVATTESDQTNIVVCSLAKTIGNPFTIARVKNMDYLHVWGRGRKFLGVDLMVCSIPLIAKSVVNVLNFPNLRLLRNLYGPLYVAEALETPEGVWHAEVAGRKIVVGTRPEIERAFIRTEAKRVLILGASEVGILIGEMASKIGHEVKIIEFDRDRARKAAERAEKAVVINGDPFDISLWEREELQNAHVSVSSFNEDERNLFGALLSKRMGIRRIFAILHNWEFIDLFDEHGITAVSPEMVTAERIVVATLHEDVLGVVSSISGIAVLAVKAGKKLEGRSPRELNAVIGPILREGEVMLPDEDLRFREDDILTIILPEEKLGDLRL